MKFFKKAWHSLKKVPNYIALGLIWAYRTFISPFQTRNNCIFYPTCSEYAKESFKKYPFLKAFRKTAARISRCHPGNEPSVDLP
jgi:putative membrane protein insertion efficiency factor